MILFSWKFRIFKSSFIMAVCLQKRYTMAFYAAQIGVFIARCLLYLDDPVDLVPRGVLMLYACKLLTVNLSVNLLCICRKWLAIFLELCAAVCFVSRSYSTRCWVLLQVSSTSLLLTCIWPFKTLLQAVHQKVISNIFALIIRLLAPVWLLG